MNKSQKSARVSGTRRLETIIDRLEADLAREKRKSGALAEWFVTRDHATCELGVITGSGEQRKPSLRVVVHGITRAAGGVAVVQALDEEGIVAFSNLPRYLDDILVEWMHDDAAEIREAARILRMRRDEYCKQAKEQAP